MSNISVIDNSKTMEALQVCAAGAAAGIFIAGGAAFKATKHPVIVGGAAAVGALGGCVAALEAKYNITK